MGRRTLNFTKESIEGLRPPAEGRVEYHDINPKRVRGLILRVSYTGSKVFYLYRKVAGRPERIRVGEFPDVSVETARGLAEGLRSRIALGHNPAEERRQSKLASQEMTLGQLFDLYLDQHAKPRKRSWEQDVYLFKRHLEPWKGRRLSAVRRADVQSLHAKLGAGTGKATANNVLALLSSMYNRAAEWGFAGGNPCSGVKKFRIPQRERFLRPEEVPRFFTALAAEPNATLREFFLVALLTGQRRANVQAMRWRDVDLTAGVWRIPETKGGKPHTVALVPEVVRILELRRGQTGDSHFVFPGRGRTGHLVEPKAAWRRVLIRAQLFDPKALEVVKDRTVREVIHLALLTAEPRQLVQAMRWADVDLEMATWTVRGTGAEDARTVALPEPATSLLCVRRDDARGNWVFPAGNVAGHVRVPASAWNQAVNADLFDLRIHDLRRSLASWQAALGANLALIQQTLGHANISTTMIYARLNLDPVREAMEQATSAILTAAGVAADGKTIPFEKGRGN